VWAVLLTPLWMSFWPAGSNINRIMFTRYPCSGNLKQRSCYWDMLQPQQENTLVVSWYRFRMCILVIAILGAIHYTNYTHKQKVIIAREFSYWLQTWTVERLSVRHQTALVMFLGFRKPLYSCTEGMCHSSICPGTSYHVTQFYQAFPHISTASDKRWGEKAWVWG